jgi:hypothetical protein
MLKKQPVPNEPRTEMLGVLITKSLRAELEAIAEREERSLSYVGYALMMKGLDEYQKDSDLRSPRNLPLKNTKKK